MSQFWVVFRSLKSPCYTNNWQIGSPSPTSQQKNPWKQSEIKIQLTSHEPIQPLARDSLRAACTVSSEHNSLLPPGPQVPALGNCKMEAPVSSRVHQSHHTWLFLIYRNEDRILSMCMSEEGVEFVPNCESLKGKKPGCQPSHPPEPRPNPSPTQAGTSVPSAYRRQHTYQVAFHITHRACRFFFTAV